ncbi:AraC family transcriptional regulator ligand-binding domain-containing protein [Meridianimarinicoccus sp. RP-17]|uniref:AraC family transcriptional regulator ligand-binding domain-containing protein n=1 Tax=Meridianimarinicoccus zhengii TaxID=2056810 RepID=UPI000DAC21E7|nr:AraC family transcriptional regulator ligand-binding domain-containing protein [Phycocomes zhengii]
MHAQDRSAIYTSAVLSGPVCGMLGVDWADVLAHAGIVATERNDRAFLVSADEYLRLWTAMMDLSGQPDVARLLGLRMAGGPAIPVLFALSTAPDFETGIARMAQFKSLFGPMRFVVTQSESEFTVRVAPDLPGTALPGTFTSPQIVYLHAQANALARQPIRPLRLCVSIKFVNDMVRLKRETGALAPKPQGNPGRGKLTDVKDWVRRRIAAAPTSRSMN